MPFLLPVLAGTTAFFSACREANQFVPPPPPEVTVLTVEPREATTHTEVSGRIQAVDAVDIVARVNGFIQSVEFEAGTFVTSGQLLFRIEDDQYQAAVSAAEARLASATAERDRAQVTFERREQLLRNNAVAELDVIEARASRDSAVAAVQSAQAALDKARLDLSYTQVTSPIDGRVTRELVSQGTLVNAAQGTVLTRVVSQNPVYVFANLGEQTILPYLQRGGRANSDGPQDIRLRLADGGIYPLKGRIDFVDSEFDATTGTITVRAVFENPDLTLVPGLFARLGFPMRREAAFVVPQAALQQDLQGMFLLALDEDNVVSNVRVQTGPRTEDGIVIVSGLEQGDRIIVEGLQRAREGVTVAPSMEQTVPSNADPDSPASETDVQRTDDEVPPGA